MSWNSLGLISVIASWVGLLFMIWYWKGEMSKTFSQNAARQKSSIIYYALLWLICLPPFAWFILFPFYESLELNIWFRIIGLIASLSLLTAALIPETTGWRVKVHRFAAFTMAVCFMPLVLLILLSSVISTFAQAVCIFSLLFMIFGAQNAYRHGPEHPKLLLGQGLYIAVFQLSVIIAYYL